MFFLLSPHFSHRTSFIHPDEIVCCDSNVNLVSPPGRWSRADASEDVTLWTRLRDLDSVSGASLDESIVILAVEQICLEGASPDPNSAPFQLP